ncbi:WbqC family protein [Bacteroidota bacterium]
MGAEDTVLLSTSYFGSIQYFTKFLLYPNRYIERYDHYTKQTYRNRCNIFGANGVLSLSIPVLKGPLHKTYVKDIRIDYSKNWRKLHWKGIESAYMHSPFFEFYMDDISKFLEKQHEFLLDLNTEFLEYLLELLEIDGSYTYTEGFIESGDFTDCRDTIHPKKSPLNDPSFISSPYSQVFADRLGFQENLSIIDMLFNEGPNARAVLENCLSQAD